MEIQKGKKWPIIAIQSKWQIQDLSLCIPVPPFPPRPHTHHSLSFLLPRWGSLDDERVLGLSQEERSGHYQAWPLSFTQSSSTSVCFTSQQF